MMSHQLTLLAVSMSIGLKKARVIEIFIVWKMSRDFCVSPILIFLWDLRFNLTKELSLSTFHFDFIKRVFDLYQNFYGNLIKRIWADIIILSRNYFKVLCVAILGELTNLCKRAGVLLQPISGDDSVVKLNALEPN